MDHNWKLSDDLYNICKHFSSDIESLSGKKIFITGGTGFIGRWLLELIKYHNCRSEEKIYALVLSRNPDKFFNKASHFKSDNAISFLSGDVIDFKFPAGSFDYIVHAATEASAELNKNDPLLMFDTIVNGTRRVLEFSRKCGAKVLNLSSGAVYGVGLESGCSYNEDWMTAPNVQNPISVYGEAKRCAELLCAVYAKNYSVEYVTARIFAVLGPFLPLNTHFAAGNFILDAMNAREIVIQSSGQAVRSYLYASDLIAWLLVILLRGKSGECYNVGSEDGVSIKEMASLVNAILSGGGVSVMGSPDPGWNSGRYVPSIEKLKKDFSLKPLVSLDSAIVRTAISNGWDAKYEII